MDLDRLIEGNNIIITCGAGGVGKTTCAAAIACHGVRMGRKVAVLTVDPARRLASSLGFDNFAEEIKIVPVPSRTGEVDLELHAAMLDVRSTFDRLVTRYTSSEQADVILCNKFYRHFTGSVGGTHEYTAMERLHELWESGRWDLLVLDTPPTVHALDFLDAPQRLIDLFDETVFRWIIKPYLAAGKVGVQVLSFGSAYIIKTLTRFVGGEMLQDLSEFLFLFQDLFEGFQKRAREVQELLLSEKTSFLIVSTAKTNALQDAALFHRELTRKGLPFGGFLINRTLNDPPEGFDEETISSRVLNNLAAPWADSPDFAEHLLESYSDYRTSVVQQGRLLRRFTVGITPQPDVFRVLLFNRDVSDVEGLIHFAENISLELSR